MKFINFLKGRLSSKRGLTMMELLVSLAVFGIIVTSVSSILPPILKTHTSIVESADVIVVASSIENILTKEISHAIQRPNILDYNTIEILTTTGTVTFSVVDGKLTKNLVPYFDDSYYADKRIRVFFSYSATDPDTVTIQISVISKRGDILFSKEAHCKPMQ